MIGSTEDLEAWELLLNEIRTHTEIQVEILRALNNIVDILNNIVDRLDNITGAIKGER